MTTATVLITLARSAQITFWVMSWFIIGQAAYAVLYHIRTSGHAGLWHTLILLGFGGMEYLLGEAVYRAPTFALSWRVWAYLSCMVVLSVGSLGLHIVITRTPPAQRKGEEGREAA